MARLVRATHDLGVEGSRAGSRRPALQKIAIMGRPDKPGDDERRSG